MTKIMTCMISFSYMREWASIFLKEISEFKLLLLDICTCYVFSFCLL